MRISTRSISLFRDLVTVGRAGRGQGTSPRSSLSAGCRFRTVHCRAWSASFTTSARKEELVLPRYRLRPGPLSESIFASLGAYFRAYLHALDNAGADGAPVCRDPRPGPARITTPGHIRQRCSRFVGLSSLGVSSSPFLLGTAGVP
jgi:hypothetical protein